MDTQVIGRVSELPPAVITPLGNDTILSRAVPGLTATAVDWDGKVDLGDGLTVHVGRPCSRRAASATVCTRYGRASS